jgi:hypothetical protein
MSARLWRNSATLTSSAFMAVALMVVPAMARPQDASQQSTGDPVADAARKAREQKRKDTAKPKRVYTDEDLTHVVTSETPASADAKGTTEEGAGKNPDAQGKDGAGKTTGSKEDPETTWRKQFKDAYANLNRAQKELDILQREDNKAQVQYYSDPQKALAEQYTRKDIIDKDTKIAAKKKEVDQLKQRISDMEDALRKSGGDPGWAAP